MAESITATRGRGPLPDHIQEKSPKSFALATAPFWQPAAFSLFHADLLFCSRKNAARSGNSSVLIVFRLFAATLGMTDVTFIPLLKGRYSKMVFGTCRNPENTRRNAHRTLVIAGEDCVLFYAPPNGRVLVSAARPVPPDERCLANRPRRFLRQTDELANSFFVLRM